MRATCTSLRAAPASTSIDALACAAVRIPRHIYEQLIDHAREDAPNECCGLIGGGDGEARTLYRARNAESSPLRYRLDPQDQFKIMSEIDDKGEELVAIYHSHTKSPAYPSQTDINLALAEAGGERVQLFPGTIYLIASLAEREQPLRGFDIAADQVREVDLEIG
jgi:[CysO sulfur-carrier protein]-S-L-cysteine hydrolase